MLGAQLSLVVSISLLDLESSPKDMFLQWRQRSRCTCYGVLLLLWIIILSMSHTRSAVLNDSRDCNACHCLELCARVASAVPEIPSVLIGLASNSIQQRSRFLPLAVLCKETAYRTRWPDCRQLT